MPYYTFEPLSSHEFELLTRDLLQEMLGIRLESFKSGRDKGIDLRYAPDDANSLIVQCKHYLKSGVIALKYHIKNKEVPKVQKLNPKRYIFVTSVGLSPGDKDDLLSLLSPYCTSPSDILGQEDLNNLLGQYPHIEKQHYKLWLTSISVLETLLHSAILNRTQVELKRIHSKLKYYVQNASFDQAQSMLEQHHYCIIMGVPGIGKTTLAEALFFDHASRGFQPIRIYNSIDEGFQMLRPETSQVFYFDDFLGTTAFDEDSYERNENKQLLAFIQSINSSNGEKKFILTTRDYIWQQARLVLESLGTADLSSSACIINLYNYTRFNRAEILYNHVYFSDLEGKQIEDLLKKKRYLDVIDHPNYNPRIIEWMTQFERWRPDPNDDFATAFVDALNNPMDLWRYAFDRHLSSEARSLLLALVSLPDRVHLDDLKRAFLNLYYPVAQAQGRPTHSTVFRNALDELEGTFISISQWDKKTLVVQFHNPSIRDFLESYLADDASSVQSLVNTAQFFEQIVWLWGKPRIGGLGTKLPYPIPPRYRAMLIAESELLVNSVIRTFSSDGPRVAIGYRSRRRPYRLARRILFILELKNTIKDERLQQLVKDALPALKARAEGGEEATYELARLVDRLRQSPEVLELKDAFLKSLNSMAGFERYLLFKVRYADLITEEDEVFVEERFKELFPGRDLSIIDREEYYEPDVSSFAELDIRSERDTDKIRVDPNQRIYDLFDSLSE